MYPMPEPKPKPIQPPRLYRSVEGCAGEFPLILGEETRRLFGESGIASKIEYADTEQKCDASYIQGQPEGF